MRYSPGEGARTAVKQAPQESQRMEVGAFILLGFQRCEREPFLLRLVEQFFMMLKVLLVVGVIVHIHDTHP